MKVRHTDRARRHVSPRLADVTCRSCIPPDDAVRSPSTPSSEARQAMPWALSKTGMGSDCDLFDVACGAKFRAAKAAEAGAEGRVAVAASMRPNVRLGNLRGVRVAP